MGQNLSYNNITTNREKKIVRKRLIGENIAIPKAFLDSTQKLLSIFVTINKSFLYCFVYSYRVPQLFYPLWCLTYRYWSVMGFTRNILCSLLYGFKYPYILSVSCGAHSSTLCYISMLE